MSGTLERELAKADGRHEEAFASYEALLRDYTGAKQNAAKRLSAAFAPKTKRGLLQRNLVIRACAILGLAKLAFGEDIIDTLQLPAYGWPGPAPPAKQATYGLNESANAVLPRLSRRDASTKSDQARPASLL
jgi:hypothetical protein